MPTDDQNPDRRIADLARATLAQLTDGVDPGTEFESFQHRLADGAEIPVSSIDPSGQHHHRNWIVATAAAAVVVVVGLTSLAVGRDDRIEIVAPPTSATPAAPTPVTTQATVDDPGTTLPPSALASAEPRTVAAGEAVSVTPAAVVQRACLDIVTAIRQDDGNPKFGQILDGRWVTSDTGTDVTYPECLGERSDSTVTFVVPVTVPPGPYLMCLTDDAQPEGCAAVDVTAASDDPAACATEPFAPPSLVDGTAVGDATIESATDWRAARWGAADAPNRVLQILDTEVDNQYLDGRVAAGDAVVAGSFQAAVLPVGDPPLGTISIYVRDTTTDCTRTYIIGPGLLTGDATQVAQQWLDALSTGSPVEGPSHALLGAPYFGRRFSDTWPSFWIDSFAAAGTPNGPMSIELLEQLLASITISDALTVNLDGPSADGRCTNQSVVSVTDTGSSSLSAQLPAARSIAAGANGTIIATRDVCPDGTRWGDPDTRWELVTYDPNTPDVPPQVVFTRPSDPAAIQFDDGTVVYAAGEMRISSVSPGGRSVGLQEAYNSEQAKWHLVDLAVPNSIKTLPSDCAIAGDIVAPPRFIDTRTVVIARVCASLDAGDPSPYTAVGGGDIQIEVVDLVTLTVTSRTSVPGLGPDGYSRTAGLSVTQSDDPTPWILLTAGGGVEIPGRTYSIHGDDIVEITRTGYHDFAFDPLELISIFDRTRQQ